MEDIIEELFKNWSGDEFTSELFDKVKSEDFKNISKVHDWRNYVDDIFKREWHNLNGSERMLIYYFCEGRADMEEWD